MKRLLLSLAVTLGLCLGLGASAQATPAAPAASTAAAIAAPPTAQADAAAAAQAADVRQAQRLTPFIDVDTATLDVAGALKAGVDAKVVRDFQSGLTWGEAQRTESLSLTAAQAAERAVSCAGRTAFYRKLTYAEVYMNNCDVRALVGLMTAGGGVVAIAGAIVSLTGIGVPIGAALAIAGGLIAIGGGALQVCNKYARGIVLDNFGWPCRSQ